LNFIYLETVQDNKTGFLRHGEYDSSVASRKYYRNIVDRLSALFKIRRSVFFLDDFLIKTGH